MRGLLVNDIPKYLVIMIWLGINGLLFGVTYQEYENTKKYFYTRVMLGKTLAISRSAAACLNFNCLLILLPVCRNLLSLIRGWIECCPRKAKRVLDKNITFHKLCAYMIVFLTILHYVGHSFNVHRYSTSQISPQLTYTQDVSDEQRRRAELVAKLASLGNGVGETYLSPIRQPLHPVSPWAWLIIPSM